MFAGVRVRDQRPLDRLAALKLGRTINDWNQPMDTMIKLFLDMGRDGIVRVEAAVNEWIGRLPEGTQAIDVQTALGEWTGPGEGLPAIVITVWYCPSVVAKTA